MPECRKTKVIKLISKILLSDGNVQREAIEQLKELYFYIINEEQIEKTINKYRNLGSEKHDDVITKIHEDILRYATIEVISKIRSSQGKAKLKAVEELKELYLDVINEQIKKNINKYRDLGSEKYDDGITKIYEDIFRSAANKFDPGVNDNFEAYLRSGWKRFKAEEKVVKLLTKAPLTNSVFYDSDGEEVDSVKKQISNYDNGKNFSNTATAECNMLMSDLSLGFDVSTDLLRSIISSNANPCEKRIALIKIACANTQNETNFKTAPLLGSALQRRNWWIEWAEGGFDL